MRRCIPKRQTRIITLVALMIMLATVIAEAAIPNENRIIGDRAFCIGYLASDNFAGNNQALVDAGSVLVYY